MSPLYTGCESSTLLHVQFFLFLSSGDSFTPLSSRLCSTYSVHCALPARECTRGVVQVDGYEAKSPGGGFYFPQSSLGSLRLDIVTDLRSLVDFNSARFTGGLFIVLSAFVPGAVGSDNTR